jgi:hypothetical protein
VRRTITAALAALAVAPATDTKAEASTYSLARCIVHYESHGNPQARNGIYHGIAQWSPEAWHRHGGWRFARDPLWASYGQQWSVLISALRRFGCRDWCPFDPC